MILSPEVLTILILNVIFSLFGIIAFILSVKIYLKWDLSAVTKEQYSLEKYSFLTATIIKYIFAIKVPLFLFFIFTLDKISNVLTGAMCGAGVVDATSYGIYLFMLKIINLYIFAYWLALHNIDIKDEKQPYTKIKFGFFIVAFLLFMGELIVEGLMFLSIDVDKMVSCCGTIYSSSSTSYISTIFSMDTTLMLVGFYATFISIFIAKLLNKRYIYAILNILFIIISLISLITFFGTYIYELPTHHCPFCFLQKDYYYVGYLLYTSLFIGTFYGIVTGFTPSTESQKSKNANISLIFNTIYVTIVSLYAVVFYINNGVLL